MDKEELIKLGLTEEQADNVIKAHKKDLDGKYVPKDRFNDVNEKLKTANQTITDRDTQIEDLKKFKGTNEELQQKITQLQTENNEQKEKHEKEMAGIQKTQLIEHTISSQKRLPYNVQDVISKLDLEKIQVNEGQLSGFTEQYEQMLKDRPHWFKPEEPTDSNKKLFGFTFKGTEPAGNDPDGSNGPQLNKQEMFGKALAKSAMSADVTKNATDFFFGKN